MSTDLTLPELGENIEEVDVLSVLVSEGDRVLRDDPIIEIETEKATIEVPSFLAGTVSSIAVSAGDTVRVGQVILTLDELEDSGPRTDSKAENARPAEPAGGGATMAEPKPARPEIAIPAPFVPTAPAPHIPAGDQGGIPVFASPSTRTFAREIGVDVRRVEGSGPGGRISDEDVKQHSRMRAFAEPAAEAVRPLPDFSDFGPVARMPISRVRRTIAEHVGQSASTIPHVTLFESADVTEIEELRSRYKSRAEAKGGKLTITAIIIKVLAAALEAFPMVNASLDTARQEIVLKRYFHIGVAADTDRGLVVPVVRDVDKKNIIEISVELTQLAEKARSGKLSLSELRGGNLTVTNLGGLGTGHFTPIINAPDVAILGVGRVEGRPVYRESGLEPRLIAPLSLSFDHRAIDGADGARFMHWVVEALNEPHLLTLEG